MIYTAIMLGLLGSFHCVGMCGPIALMLPVDRSSRNRMTLQVIMYHSGRILTYALIGLALGGIGTGLNLFGIQQQLSIFLGLLMIALVLLPSSMLGKYRLLGPLYRLIGRLKSGLGESLKKKTPDTFFTIGFLNGFLPCGLVYMAVFGAIAIGDLGQSIWYMVLFGLGTVPLMTATVFLGNFLSPGIRKGMRRFVPVVVVIIGAVFVLRGMGLGIPYVSPKPIDQKIEASYECHDTNLVNNMNTNTTNYDLQ